LPRADGGNSQVLLSRSGIMKCPLDIYLVLDRMEWFGRVLVKDISHVHVTLEYYCEAWCRNKTSLALSINASHAT
jgi:hypothetical protein